LKHETITTSVAEDKKKISDNIKEDCLQVISQKTMFDEVFQHQMRIIENRDRENKQQKLKEAE
jgi:hypothetical protein